MNEETVYERVAREQRVREQRARPGTSVKRVLLRAVCFPLFLLVLPLSAWGRYCMRRDARRWARGEPR
jgi:hypothetical protein